MSAAHTPGPWVWEGNTLRPAHRDPANSAVYSILDAEGGFGFLGSKPSDTNAELDANRHLIEAAPDMLEALHSARKLIAADRESFADCNSQRALRADDDPTLFEQIGELLFEAQDAAFVRTYDVALAQIDAAVAKATGERC